MNTQLTVPQSALSVVPDTAPALVEFKTPQEAGDATAAFNKKADLLRHDLLDLFLRNAHGVLGYTSFDAYCADRLNIFMDKQSLYHQRQWAQVERTIAINSPVSSPVGLLPNGQPFVKLSRDTACELAKLPSPDLQRTVFEQITTLESHGHGTPRQYHNDLKKIVARMLTTNATAEVQNRTQSAADTPTPQTGARETMKRAGEDSSPQYKDAPASTSVVTGFTPPPDAPALAEEAEQVIDFADALEHLRTMQTWCETQSVDGTPRTRRQLAECLRQLAAWIETA